MNNAAFHGFARSNGRFGTRNHLLVLSVTGLTGPAGRRIAACLSGAVFAGTPYGGGLIGEDAAADRRADGDVDRRAPAVVRRGEVVDELVEAARDEVGVLDLDDGLEALQC